MLALLYSQFIFLIYSCEISFGHSASQAPVFVQCPNPSSSILSTIAITRLSLSGWPWGKDANCDTLADTNKLADAFLQAATHAPQPIQAAASNAYNASS